MGMAQDVTQKIKGQAQQVKGEIKQRSGDKLGGLVDKTKGKINESVADAKIKVRQENETDQPTSADVV